MAKIYGGRWQIVADKRLGSGGQAQVFRVTDLQGEFSGEYALKRVLNPERHERFRNEIGAIKRISHPNIIKLIDHSALGDRTAEVEKQYLVMPVASGGDLCQRGRVQLYKGLIDSVLAVGKQLADALRAAHEVGVIHRDVKPANILFTGNGHEVWVTDFGICLLRGQSRLTEAGEVVGPRAFMAPELEDGGNLDVTTAADVYSLGKVLYYMISGGVVLPRERLDEAQYKDLLLKGERQQQLLILLRQMICHLQDRIKTMSEVAKHLVAIESWEERAQLLPLSQEARSSISNLQLRAQRKIQITTANRTAREQEEERLRNTILAIEQWLKAELEKVAAFMGKDGALRCLVKQINLGDSDFTVVTPVGNYVARGGQRLIIQTDGDSGLDHSLVVGLFLKKEVRASANVNSGPKLEDVRPAQDFELAMIPVTSFDAGGGYASNLDRALVSHAICKRSRVFT
jgi:serine/threonine protein kinase